MHLKIFFGGTTKDIEEARKAAVLHLEQLRLKQNFDLVVFDGNEIRLSSLNDYVFRELIPSCDLAIFAFGPKIGTTPPDRPHTTYTLEELKLAITMKMPFYLFFRLIWIRLLQMLLQPKNPFGKRLNASLGHHFAVSLIQRMIYH